MANSIDWGQGAINNNIGWSQGAINNSIYWGSVYSASYSGETNILGSLLIYSFQQRVIEDGGEFEAGSCLNNTVTNLSNIDGTVSELSYLFEQRILTDSGVLESSECLINNLTNLNNIQ